MGMKLNNSILGNHVTLSGDEVIVNGKVVYKGENADALYWSTYYELIQLCGKACDEVVRQWLAAK